MRKYASILIVYIVCNSYAYIIYAHTLIGYNGTRCEINIDACSVNQSTPPCRNGATCVDSDVGLEFTCLCPAGFTGKTVKSH